MKFCFFKKLYASLSEKTKDTEHQLIPYAVLGIFGFFLFYFFNSHIRPGTYENIPLRVIAFILCFILALKNHWPQKFKKFIPLYWNVTILFNLPFFFTFMLLKNPSNPIWPLYTILALTVLILVVDWLSFAILTILGTALGSIFYVLTTPSPQLPDNFSAIMVVYCSIIVYSVLFSQKNQLAQKARIQTMKMLAGSIAHELRTPLSALMMNARTLGRILPRYLEGYAKAKAANLLENTLEHDQETYIAELPENMQTLSNNAHTMITMLLANLNEDTADRKVEKCSMKLCVKEALGTYPFSTSEREIVHWESGSMTEDFTFLGHKELTKHVLFNLLKNALYAIASVGKGEIYITLEADAVNKGRCRLIFKDTGLGISRDNLSHVFDRFYTRTRHGTGIGLAFCKATIEGFGGKITCDSKDGEHTTFTIILPVVGEETLQAA